MKVAKEMALDEWVVKVNNEVREEEDRYANTYTQRSKKSIYRIPDSTRNLNEVAYTPQWVSFGPYHHGKEHLKPMEEHKHRALVRFLKRCGIYVDECFAALKDVEQDLVDSYDLLDKSCNRDVFMKMMIVDGCFMLEILRRDVFMDDYPEKDPVLSRASDLHVLPFIRREMLMLENQLPILLLKRLAELDMEEETSVQHLMLKFCYQNVEPVLLGKKYVHLLQLYKKSLFWQDPHWGIELFRRAKITHLQIPLSAAGLSQAGIKFSTSKTSSLADISFYRGLLRLPAIEIDELTESMFLNLLAFERLHVGAGTEVTSYVHIMSSLIQDAIDVSLLRSKHIIKSAVFNDTTTAIMFKSLSKDIIIDPRNRLYRVTTSIHNYCLSPWAEWRYHLIATYIREWPLLSFLAASLLFILSTIQTVYSVYSTYHK